MAQWVRAVLEASRKKRFLKLQMDTACEIMTPKQVLAVIPISKSWLYANWVLLGGVTINRRKFIKRELFHANFQEKRVVVRENKQGEREVDPFKSGHEREPLENAKGCQTGRGRITATSRKTKNHSNEFGLVDAVQ